MKICDICKKQVDNLVRHSFFEGDLCPECQKKIVLEAEKIGNRHDMEGKKELEDFVSGLIVGPPKAEEKDGRGSKHKR